MPILTYRLLIFLGAILQLPTSPLHLLSFKPNFLKLSTNISLLETEKFIRTKVYKFSGEKNEKVNE